MAESDGVFGEGAFGSATFGNVSRSEAVSPDPSRTNAVFAVRDEGFTAFDDLSLSAAKPLGQTLTAADSITKAASLERSQKIIIQDSDVFRANINIAESIESADQVDTEADLFRLRQQIVETSDVISKQLQRQKAETVSAQDQTRSSVFLDSPVAAFDINDNQKSASSLIRTEDLVVDDDLSFLKGTSLPEAFGIQDALVRRINIVSEESVPVVDTLKKKISIIQDQDLALNDVLSDQAAIFTGLSEFVPVRDNIEDVAEQKRDFEEDLGVDDVFNRELELFRDVQEDFDIEDKESELSSLGVTAAFSLVDEISKLNVLPLSEDIDLEDRARREARYFRVLRAFPLLLDSDIKDVRKPLFESIDAVDNVETEAELFRDFSEVIDLEDNQITLAQLVFPESFSFRDVTTKRVFRVFVEDLEVQIRKELALRRGLSENFSLEDSLFRLINLNPQEVLDISDIKTVRKTVSDIAADININFGGRASGGIDSK